MKSLTETKIAAALINETILSDSQIWKLRDELVSLNLRGKMSDRRFERLNEGLDVLVERMANAESLLAS